MRLISWNVNGLRAVVKKGFDEAFAALDADVFALQETKLQEGQIELDLPGYVQNWSYAEKKGYSGTAVFSREEPLQVVHHVGTPALDTEGRICACEFEKFWFVDVYTPNAQPELARLEHRMAWDAAFREFCKNLEAGVVPEGLGYASADALAAHRYVRAGVVGHIDVHGVGVVDVVGGARREREGEPGRPRAVERVADAFVVGLAVGHLHERRACHALAEIVGRQVKVAAFRLDAQKRAAPLERFDGLMRIEILG